MIFFFFLVKRAGRHFGFFKRAGRHEKGAGRRALQKKPRQNTAYDCQASFFIDVNLQWKELRKIEKNWLAVEGTTYRGRCKSLLCAEITLTFEGFLGCGPIIPG